MHARLVEKLGDGPAADLLTAQIALETGGGRGSYNYNVGNIKALDQPGVNYQVLKTWELENGRRVDRREPFMSYDSLDAGLDHYIRFLDQRGLLDAADTGDVDAFNRALKAAGYYTADETKYGNILRRRLTEVREQLGVGSPRASL